jgi:heptosyltransferase-2
VKKILIIQTAFLGDVILATPIAENLKANFLNIEIHYVVKKGNESLLSNHKYIDKVWVFDKKNGKFKNILQLAKNLRKEKFDLVLKKNPMSFMYTKSYIHEIGNGDHEVDRNLSLLSSLNLKDFVKRPSLFPSDSDQEKISEYQSKPYYCIAPASVWATKQLPKEKWIDLIKLLSLRSQVYVLGSPADKPFCNELRDRSKTNAINLAGKLSLLQSAALMKDAERNFVNDSGPLHLASSVNARVTAFFCSTIPAFGFGPLSDDSEIRETKEKLDCRPCGLHGYSACPKGHFKCGEISLKDI